MQTSTLAVRSHAGKHWRGVPASSWAEKSIEEVAALLPAFSRHPFLGMTSDRRICSSNMDMIVREPLLEAERPTAVGIVSKNYNLVQHSDVLLLAIEAMKTAKIDTNEVRCDLLLTEHGERMALALRFPDDMKYRFAISNNDQMALRLECFNSVDGSMRLTALLGWLRFVCSNGLIVGAPLGRLRQQHTDALNLKDLAKLLKVGLKRVVEEKKGYGIWLKAKVGIEALSPWVDRRLSKAWGIRTAARVYGILTSGYDVVVKPFQTGTATHLDYERSTPVPGAPQTVESVFDVAQTLSWVAAQHPDFDEQALRIRQIPGLLRPLLN